MLGARFGRGYDLVLRRAASTAPGDAINAFDPARIEIGARVRVVFDAVSDELHLPRWVLG